MIEFLKNVKLTISQWLLLASLSIIGILGIVLKYKQHELDLMRISKLQDHFGIEQEKADLALKMSQDALSKSKERLYEAVQAYNNKHTQFDYTSNDDNG